MSEFYELADTVIDDAEWAEDISARLSGTGLAVFYDVEHSNYVIVEETA